MHNFGTAPTIVQHNTMLLKPSPRTRDKAVVLNAKTDVWRRRSSHAIGAPRPLSTPTKFSIACSICACCWNRRRIFKLILQEWNMRFFPGPCIHLLLIIFRQRFIFFDSFGRVLLIPLSLARWKSWAGEGRKKSFSRRQLFDSRLDDSLSLFYVRGGSVGQKRKFKSVSSR